jgi:glycerol-1-phosphate dehydrogenase [NAD(P)+]
MDLGTALTYATDTAHFETGEIIEKCGTVYRKYFGDRKGFVVADENTFEVAGRTASEHLAREGVILDEPLIFPGSPVLPCDYRIIEELRDDIKSRGAVPIAVGSGTLNDLVKVASFEADTKYMVIATAASVDGYSAPGASIVRDGFKNSIYCRAPHVIMADTRVLRSAPSEMSAAGYGDLSSKYTAGADWIIADKLESDPIDQVCWQIVQDDLDSWLDNPDGVAQNDPTSFEKLFLGLTMTGISMQRLRKSRPASGAEHLMSHIWEMRHLMVNRRPVSHGFKVAIATLAITALMERIFERTGEQVDRNAWVDWPAKEARISSVFDEPIRASVLSESRAKHITQDQHNRRIELGVGQWNEMAQAVGAQLLPYAQLRERFVKAGAPVAPESIGLSREDVCETYELAAMIRNRYTSIDLAIETGLLDDCIQEILSSDLYFR